jgi:hypothetical protein
VGNEVYVLNGPRAELDKFAGGRATITGNLSDGTLTVEQMTTAKNVVPVNHSRLNDFGSGKSNYQFNPVVGLLNETFSSNLRLMDAGEYTQADRNR